MQKIWGLIPHGIQLLLVTEICGLIFILGCSLVHLAPTRYDAGCMEWLKKNAMNLESYIKDVIGISSTLKYNPAKLPSCNAPQNEVGPIVKAFHTLFKQLNKTIEGAGEIGILQKTLHQQRVCLSHWNVTNSSINIPDNETDQTGKKILLFKASECYSWLMQKFWNEMEAEAVNGSS